MTGTPGGRAQSHLPDSWCDLALPTSPPFQVFYFAFMATAQWRFPRWLEVESQGGIIPLPPEVTQVASESQWLVAHPCRCGCGGSVLSGSMDPDSGCSAVHGRRASQSLCGADGLTSAVPRTARPHGRLGCAPSEGTSVICSPVNLSPCLGWKD